MIENSVKEIGYRAIRGRQLLVPATYLGSGWLPGMDKYTGVLIWECRFCCDFQIRRPGV